MVSAKATRWIRYGEAVAVLGLGAVAFITYAELRDLRKAPVALPNYEFEMSRDGDLVQTRGTWISEKGLPESLQTTTIECRKATMRCAESAAAVVFIEGKGVLESRITDFEIERWDKREIAAKPAADRCMTRTLSLDLVEKHAHSHVTPTRDRDARCKDAPERTLELVAGYKLREQPR
jgi:hypothetical protein